jgi:hypothetical protein
MAREMIQAEQETFLDPGRREVRFWIIRTDGKSNDAGVQPGYPPAM